MPAPSRILIGVNVVEAIPEIVQGVQAYVEQRACRWRVRCVGSTSVAQLLRAGTADGAIVSFSPGQHALVTELTATGVPLVNIVHDCHPLLPSVVSHEREVGRAAAKDFLGRGFQNFGYLGFNSPWSNGRQEGFVDALAEAGHRCHVCKSWSADPNYLFMETPGAARTVQNWVEILPKPIAVLICADYVAAPTLESWEAAGVRVPEEVAVMGVGNFVTMCELAPVPLSSVGLDFPRMAFEASRLLDRRLSGGEGPSEPILIPPDKIVARRSTDAFQFADEHVSAAMRLIHDHAAEGMTMKRLLRAVPASRKSLDRHFKELLGRTPSQEIRRLRLERVRDLLLQTDLSLQQIAARCGFSRRENLIRFFRDGYGMPPEMYRAHARAEKMS